MAAPFNDPEAPIRTNYFIQASEASVDPANDAGKVAQLEPNGRFAPRFIPQRAAVRAYKSDSNTAAPTSYAKVTFGTENFDIGGNFASSTFTAPRAGRYLISSTCGGTSTGSSSSRSISIAIYKNGTLYSEAHTAKPGGSSLPASVSITDILDLSANDTIEIYVQTSSASEFTYNTGEKNTFISIAELF